MVARTGIHASACAWIQRHRGLLQCNGVPNLRLSVENAWPVLGSRQPEMGTQLVLRSCSVGAGPATRWPHPRGSRVFLPRRVFWALPPDRRIYPSSLTRRGAPPPWGIRFRLPLRRARSLASAARRLRGLEPKGVQRPRLDPLGHARADRLAAKHAHHAPRVGAREARDQPNLVGVVGPLTLRCLRHPSSMSSPVRRSSARGMRVHDAYITLPWSFRLSTAEADRGARATRASSSSRRCSRLPHGAFA